MALQLSTAVRNAMLDAIETGIGASPTLEVRSGAPPSDCASADTGTVLATLTLPSDFFADASNGSKALAGTWEDTSADATGTAGHFRIKQGATCHMQGLVTQGGADLSVDNTAFASGQQFTINSFTVSAQNG